MISADEVRKILEDKLNTHTWAKLKSSFIGRELIEYATIVINQNNLYKKILQYQQYPDTADLDGLLMQAYNLELAVDLDKPSYVKLTAETGSIVKPFSARFQVGTSLFTNWLFSLPGEQITLYQGTVKSTFNNQVEDLQYDSKNQFTVYYDKGENSYYIKLGTYALAETVRVVSSEEGVFYLYSPYESLREGSEQRMYKLKRNYDGSLNVYFGDGSWAKRYDPSNDYQVTWIDSSNNDFDVSQGKLFVDKQSTSFAVESYDSGVFSDVEYVRESLKASIAKNAVIGTEYQIKAAVRNYPTVLDCVVNSDEASENRIKVWVKPTDLSDMIFDDVQDMLNLRGEIVVQYEVVPGSPLYFNVVLQQIQPVTQQIKSNIKLRLQQEFLYANLPYKADVSSVKVSEIANSLAPGSVSTSVQLSQHFDQIVNEIILPIRPFRGSIQIYRNGELVGWDAEGILYGMFNQSTINFVQDGKVIPPVKIGDFFIESFSDKVFSYNSAFNQKVDNSEFFQFFGMTQFLKDGDVLLSSDGSKIYKLAINVSFEEGEFSLQKNPSSQINFEKIITSSLSFDYSVYKENIGIFRVELVSGLWYLFRYDESTGFLKTPNFSIPVSTSENWEIISVVEKDDNLVIFFKDHIRIVKSFSTTPTSSEEVLFVGVSEIDNHLSEYNQFYGKDTLYGWRVEQTGNYKNTLFAFTGWSIVGDSVNRLILTSEPKVVTTYNSDAIETITFLDYTRSTVYWFNSESRTVNYAAAVVVQVAREGDPIYEYAKIGVISYNTKTISLSGRSESNLDIVYVAAESLSEADDSMFPVLNSVSWLDE